MSGKDFHIIYVIPTYPEGLVDRYYLRARKNRLHPLLIIITILLNRPMILG
jgi:hypothetical protein